LNKFWQRIPADGGVLNKKIAQKRLPVCGLQSLPTAFFWMATGLFDPAALCLGHR
jgi:hypothetical protein